MFGGVFFGSVTFAQVPPFAEQTVQPITGISRIVAFEMPEGATRHDLKGRARITGGLMLLGTKFLTGKATIKGGTEVISASDPGNAPIVLALTSYKNIAGRAFVTRGGTVRTEWKDLTACARIKGGVEVIVPPDAEDPPATITITGTGSYELKGRARIYNPILMVPGDRALLGRARIKAHVFQH